MKHKLSLLVLGIWFWTLACGTMGLIALLDNKPETPPLDAAAQAACGENAAWTRLDNNTVQCFDKRGRKTVKQTIGERDENQNGMRPMRK